MAFDVLDIKKEFPVLQQLQKGKPLAYLDNAATTQKPKRVLDCLNQFYNNEYATVHRGAYLLSEKATQKFEAVRSKVKTFLNANQNSEIIYTKGTTEGINLISNTWGRKNISEGDEIIVSAMEHHSNIVPWQMLCEEKKATLKVIPMTQEGVLIIDEYKNLLSDKTKIVSVNHVSNALGTVNPVKEICSLAHQFNAIAIVDGAQSTPHLKVDVQDIDCDFYAFSSHKIYGPSSVGALYGRYEILENMPPFHGGGDMIHSVSFEKTSYAKPPAKFEAGTPAIAEIIGMGEAIDFLLEVGLENISNHEEELLNHAYEVLKPIEGLTFYGTAPHKAGVVSFMLEKAHPHDIATITDSEGVQIRAGHHCAQPVMTFFNIPATARASFGLYTTHDDIDQLAKALKKVNTIF